MIKLLAPAISVMEGNGLIPPIATPPQPIDSVSSTVGATLDIMQWFGYLGVLVLLIVSIVFLVRFFVSKANGSQNAKRDLIIFIVLFAICAFLGIGVTVLNVVWTAMESI